MPSEQQTKVDELRGEVMRLRAKLDDCEGAVYRWARSHWLSYHEVQYHDSDAARALTQDAAQARSAWFNKNEELREAMWYLHHPDVPFTP